MESKQQVGHSGAVLRILQVSGDSAITAEPSHLRQPRRIESGAVVIFAGYIAAHCVTF